jgi:CBS domain containing-hemolysin-like protein
VRLKEFKADIDRPLAAILTLNTIAHTVGAIGVGDQAAAIWSDTNPIVTTLVIPVAMTLGILILSEIIPKTLGANYWKELAPFTVTCLTLIIRLLFPFVWFSQLITGALKKEKGGSLFSRSEFLAMADMGREHGVIEDSESDIIKNLLRFNSVLAKDIMTPRVVIKVAPAAITLREFYEANPNLRFSRVPIHGEGGTEDIVGYLLKSELLKQLVEKGDELQVEQIKRELMVINENFPIPELFNGFMERREHIALVVDEYGGVSGLVTMEDVIETLLGLEIVDENDKAEDMQVLARQAWERRAESMGLLDQFESSVKESGGV